MKINTLIIYVLLFCFTSNAQVINGSFENASGPDISNWSWTCGAVLANTAPTNGGSWSLFVEGGNTQSCFPGYAYQKIPSIVNGETFVLSGWALASSPQMTGHHVGIYFGKINNGIITLQAGDTTSSLSWKSLSVLSSFSLNPGDTAVVVLFGGLVGGPIQANGIFDLINLQQVTSIDDVKQDPPIALFPNPATKSIILNSGKYLTNANCKLFNSHGKLVKEIEHLTGNKITILLDGLASGSYYIGLAENNNYLLIKKLLLIK